MIGELTIKQMLAAMGIEVRKGGELSIRELWRGDEFLGYFTAGGAAAGFLAEQVQP